MQSACRGNNFKHSIFSPIKSENLNETTPPHQENRIIIRNEFVPVWGIMTLLFKKKGAERSVFQEMLRAFCFRENFITSNFKSR